MKYRDLKKIIYAVERKVAMLLGALFSTRMVNTKTETANIRDMANYGAIFVLDICGGVYTKYGSYNVLN